LDALEVTFDDPRAMANGGLVLPMTLPDRLGLKELVDKNVHLGDAPGHANVGQKAMALVASALVGGGSIEDADVLRTGRADALLGRWVPAPSTLGTFLRSFSWADARSLDKVAAELLKRAWAAGAGPGGGPLTIDVGSSICRAYGLKKEGVTFGYTKVRGLHPLLATALGQVTGVRQRGGNAHTARGAASFVAEVANRVRAAGATGPLALRGGSGFYNRKVVGACQRANVRFSVTAKMSKSLRRAIDKIPEEAWTAIPYWAEGGAQVAETTYRAFGQEELRLVVRRVKPTPGGAGVDEAPARRDPARRAPGRRGPRAGTGLRTDPLRFRASPGRRRVHRRGRRCRVALPSLRSSDRCYGSLNVAPTRLTLKPEEPGEVGKIFLERNPHVFERSLVVIMDNNVPHTTDKMPWYVVVSILILV
jgi:hypothetical protein